MAIIINKASNLFSVYETVDTNSVPNNICLEITLVSILARHALPVDLILNCISSVRVKCNENRVIECKCLKTVWLGL